MRLDDRTFAIGERAAELMKTYCESAAPRSYELWFNYVTGTRPQLNEAVKSRLADCGTLAERDIDELYETHLAIDIPAARAAEAGAGMVTRIVTRFDGEPGKYVWHCHYLEHEDNEMMRPYELIA